LNYRNAFIFVIQINFCLVNQTIVLPSAYLPNIYYFSLLLKDNVVIDIHEHFVKQTIRNRCCIYSANGALNLSIPLSKSPNNTSTKDKLLSTETNWSILHWRSIESAYNSSAYFEFFEDDLKPLFLNPPTLNLVDWNTILIKTIFKILRFDHPINFADQYILPSEQILDERTIFSDTQTEIVFRPYYQVFSDKHGFIPNLSILDLLFHQGLKSIDYLKSI
jgi:hypothetical protein